MRRALSLLFAVVVLANPLAGQVVQQQSENSVVLAPGARYRRIGAVEVMLGRHYRDLWATTIRVPVLDLHRFGGGLTPILAHSGSQTRSMRLKGGDGRTYQFRSVEKNPLSMLAPELRETIAAWAVEDGASSSHPVSALVASALLGAAGVLHVEQTLVVLPDDPALGEYRAEFAGRFGMIEERPDETGQQASTFAGAYQIVSPGRLFERLDRSPDDLVDARAFLVARLMDILMGDRDRHRDQFRWARLDSTKQSRWQPISRDHDEAFVKMDGPILDVAALYFPQIVNFTDDYPPHYRLNWHAREIDRRFLVELSRQAWDSLATAVQARLTDSVIDGAVRQLPAEMYAVGGAAMARTLKIRRDKLVTEALSYYAFLSNEVEIHATNAAEIADVTRVDDHHVDVTIRRREDGARPYFARRFTDTETREIRLKLWGGDDRVVVRGEGAPNITLRIVGGGGDDELVDSTRTGGVAFYDAGGRTTLTTTRGERVNTRRYTEWVGSDSSRYPPREWGSWWRPIPWVGLGSDLGVLVGAGFTRTRYGFRKAPFASEISARVGYATGPAALGAELVADVRRENNPQFWRLRLLASGMEVLRYFGLGNESALGGSSEYHRVSQEQYSFEPSAVWPLGGHGQITVGPVARWSRTSMNAGRFIATIRDTLYGGHELGLIGGRLGIVVDTRDKAPNPRQGLFLSAEGRFNPGLWDVTEAFGSAEARAEAYLSAPVPLAPTLALRVNGKKLWGSFPYYEAAFLGGPSSLRGYYAQRFAGDGSLSSSAELRVTVLRTHGFFPALWGAFGNADAGRVYVDGRSPGGWHTGVGGGLWIAVLDRANTIAIGATHSAEQTALRAGFGFGF